MILLKSQEEIELIEERYASDAEVLEEARKRGEEKVQDFYMEALCNMSAEDIQRIDSRQWKRILDKIYEQARIDVIREKVEKHLNEKSEAEESEDVLKFSTVDTVPLLGVLAQDIKHSTKKPHKIGNRPQSSLRYILITNPYSQHQKNHHFLFL